jgi:predicted metal-binding membrane protein
MSGLLVEGRAADERRGAPGAAPLRLPRRVRAGLVAALVVLAGAAWVATELRMAGMGGGSSGELGSLGFYTSVWVVMMAAMMFPSISPMVVAYGAVQRARRQAGRRTPVAGAALFVGGYLLAWTLYGLVAYGVLAVGRAADDGALAWDRGGPYVAGAVILGAAVYQLTPAKDVCLRKCRNPMTFVLGGLRDGQAGALRMGVEHGAWCVGCCWALMAALFALGAMSLGWMAVVGAVIAIEKMLPWKALASFSATAALVALGIWVMVAPASVPGVSHGRMGPEMGSGAGAEMSSQMRGGMSQVKMPRHSRGATPKRR